MQVRTRTIALLEIVERAALVTVTGVMIAPSCTKSPEMTRKEAPVMQSEDSRKRVFEWLAKPPFDDPRSLAQQPHFSYEDWFAEGRALPGIVEVLIEILEEENLERPSGQGERVAYGLRWVGDKRAEKALVRALKSNDPALRTEAAAALGKVGSAGAFDPLRHILENEKEDPSVRANAAIAIGQLAPPGGREVLEKAQQDHEPFVARAAAEGLRMMGQGTTLP
jgi:hypothetical protein